MDWAGAIERNREALTGIVAALFAMLGLTSGGSLPRAVHRAVLRVLTPAEAALRRLIVIAARGLVVKPAPARPKPPGRRGQGRVSRPCFRLVDPRQRLAPPRRGIAPRAEPRIHFFASDPRVAALWATRPAAADPAPPPPDGLIDTGRLCRRLHALKLALEDMPRQAKRLARWRARQEKLPAPKFVSPLRLGPPPGYRKKPLHEVDEVLIECHGLAFRALQSDTS